MATGCLVLTWVWLLDVLNCEEEITSLVLCFMVKSFSSPSPFGLGCMKTE